MNAMVLAEIIGPELLIVLAVAALLFGSARLPQLARSLGSARSEFAKGVREGEGADAAPGPAAPEDRITMTRAELDALLDEHESRGRLGGSPPPKPT